MRQIASVVLFGIACAIPATAHARGCSEVSDVTGEQKCSRFGSTWSVERTPPIIFRFGLRYSEVTTDDLHFSATKTKGANDSVAYAFHGRSLGFHSLTGVGADGGLGFFIWGQLYAGFETHLSLGNVTTRDTMLRTQSSPLFLTQESGLNLITFGGAIPIGYRIPLGRAAIRTETAFGFEEIEIEQHATLANGHNWTGTASAMRPIIEPRVAAEIWFTQHLAFSVTGGINVLGGNSDHSLGISLAWHYRAFDGASAF